MPWYNDLRPNSDPKKQQYSVTFPEYKDEHKLRTVKNLMTIREHLEPIRTRKKTDDNILLASWNIKHFGSLKNRIPDSFFYIAEIISTFDLVALQELKPGLDDLKTVMKLLGYHWKYIVNDVTAGNEGNDERFGYLYNSERVEFTGLAGEIVLWKELFTSTDIFQIKRTPYITGFRAGWKSFSLVNLHLHPDDDSDDRAFRKKEVELILKVLNKKRSSKSLPSDNLILLGDFNLYHDDNDIVDLLTGERFNESDLLIGLKTNTAKTSDEPFDRMFFWESDFFKTPMQADGLNGGVVKIFEHLYVESDFEEYKEEMMAHKGDNSTLTSDDKFMRYFRDHWRKNQLSDHLPIWVEIKIDSTDNFLKLKEKSLEKIIENGTT